MPWPDVRSKNSQCVSEAGFCVTFVHDLKVTFNQWSVRGDKTNEPGCLKRHLESLFQKYPMLELLTGDAIFAQRPLLEALKQHGRKYLAGTPAKEHFQLKENGSSGNSVP
jgi:hypothetical protein